MNKVKSSIKKKRLEEINEIEKINETKGCFFYKVQQNLNMVNQTAKKSTEKTKITV